MVAPLVGVSKQQWMQAKNDADDNGDSVFVSSPTIPPVMTTTTDENTNTRVNKNPIIRPNIGNTNGSGGGGGSSTCIIHDSSDHPTNSTHSKTSASSSSSMMTTSYPPSEKNNSHQNNNNKLLSHSLHDSMLQKHHKDDPMEFYTIEAVLGEGSMVRTEYGMFENTVGVVLGATSLARFCVTNSLLHCMLLFQSFRTLNNPTLLNIL